MKVTFLGGTETVTGSKFLVSSQNTQVLVDCGLFQGYKWLRERNWQGLSVDRQSLAAVILTHAHLDHSGYLPVLYREGYRGPVYCHPATQALCGVLLPDSGHLQEEDARFYSRHRLGKHAHPEPLYDSATAERCLALLKPVEFEQVFSVGDMKISLHPVGHILGAACVIIEAEGKRIGFSGDVGRPDDLFMLPPKPLPELDLLMLESTYGNRRHDKTDPCEQLGEVVNETVSGGGVLLIPSFAVGRAQVLQHMLATLMADHRIPKMPVYLDSPMAIDVSDIYCQFHAIHRLSAADCRRMCRTVKYVESVKASQALSNQVYPHIIIAGSGMVSGGRILHHLKRLLSNHRTTVLLTGYQAGGTRGAKMQQGVDSVKIHGEWVKNRARIRTLHGLSGHGDFVDIGHWLEASALKPDTRIQLVHGEPEALEGMRDHLRRTLPFSVEVAGYRHILSV
ncbi:MBL fold metallo-hydrolase [Marinobacterium rhizophilum]|uniref:MBL fold metallo-hydrolase n=1 Tax=Marinobacterium rhizophilum TaxID=420402 RepID=A0ABY5HQR1_9GAMM|nr:MBL fold metallo-hydrolase [Marinobacterium rhizophilum]UTW13221.1 MBL fold metallo-hydrolase [Marinobacterium rhizophilum]